MFRTDGASRRLGATAPARFLKAGAAIVFEDPRLPALGFRGLAGHGTAENFSVNAGAYEAMRIAAAMPEGGKDYAWGDAFPHEACLDLLHGASFKKGCYVGQEVVSRMQHRGTARTRVLAVSADTPLPVGGTDIVADGFAVGRLGSVAGTRGIALARLDRVGEALAKGQPLSAGGVAVTLSVPNLGRLLARRRRGGALTRPAPELCRCPWAGSDPLYLRYHDEEWGVPKTRDIELFEKMILEGFQSGLSWITILRKRGAFREAFDGFDAAKMAGYGDAKIAELLANAGIVRHRGKIEAAIANARAYLALAEKQSLTAFLWGFVGRRGHPEPLRQPRRSAAANAAQPENLQGTQGARLPLHRPHHDLFADAGLRPRQRPSRLLPSLRALAPPWPGPGSRHSAVPGVCRFAAASFPRRREPI